MAQAVSGRPLTAETRVRAQVNECGIFSRFYTVNNIPSWLTILIYHSLSRTSSTVRRRGTHISSAV
jgi:hypothetical protein